MVVRERASGTDFSNGGTTFAIGQMAWKHNAVVEAWTPFTIANQTLESTKAPTAGTSWSYDAQLTIPISQAAGVYSSTLTYTLTAQP